MRPLNEYWAACEAEMEALTGTRLSTATEVIDILRAHDPMGPSGASGDAFFSPANAGHALHGPLLEAGWCFDWIEAEYHWQMSHPHTADTIGYCEGDVYANTPQPTPWPRRRPTTRRLPVHPGSEAPGAPDHLEPRLRIGATVHTPEPCPDHREGQSHERQLYRHRLHHRSGMPRVPDGQEETGELRHHLSGGSRPRHPAAEYLSTLHVQRAPVVVIEDGTEEYDWSDFRLDLIDKIATT